MVWFYNKTNFVSPTIFTRLCMKERKTMLVAMQTYTLAIPCEVRTPEEVYNEAIRALLYGCENCEVADLWARVVVLFDDTHRMKELVEWARNLASCSRELSYRVDLAITTHNLFTIGRHMAFADEGLNPWRFVAALAKFLVLQFGLCKGD